MNTKYTDDLKWGDKASDVEPEWIPLCHICMKNTKDMHNKEMCNECFGKGIEPSTPEYMEHIFIPPRCGECMHNNPDWICIENNRETNEIWLACAWCGYPSLKD